MAHRSFLRGAFMLMLAALITRLLGFVYRIYLSRLIGAEGMGLFQMIWPLMNLVLTFVTAGLPVAISKLVAEALISRDRVRVERILRVSANVIAVMAALFTALMWLLRNLVRQHWLTDERAYLTYLVMIPIVTVIAISSIFRGYFQGLQDMSPPAVASILETLARIGAVYALATHFIRYGIAYAAAAAMAGTVAGELVGLLFLVIQYRRRGRLSLVLSDALPRSLESRLQTLKAIADLAVPVTFSRLIGSLLWAVEPVLVTRSLLLAGLATPLATKLYGQYGSMAIPLLVFPTVFTGSLAVNLVPSVSEAIAGDERHRVRIRMAQSWRATALVGFPASVILTLFATPLCRSIYHEADVGPILAVMAPAGFLLYLQAPLSGILQGLNRAGIAMANSVIGGVVRLGLIYLLASRPDLGILGVAWATTLSVALSTTLYFLCVWHYIGFTVRVDDTAKIAVAALLMLVFMNLLAPDPDALAGSRLTAVILAGCAVYFVLCCSFRVITSATVRRIPRIGPWLATVVRRLPFAV
ncbi:MAG: stage V sporulation protein B [Alicyclobacillaceae bacterium]|nr:stage V sporulation protein B [Alicyclobacillaceae bacterium]